MRLNCEPRSGITDTHYRIGKAIISALEQYGVFTTNLLGAYVLLAVYEVSHGILPAAWLTVNGLVGLFCALGMHDKMKAVQILGRSGKSEYANLYLHTLY